MFLRQVLLLIVGCLRWKHQGRSRVIRFTPESVVGYCSLGKSRQGGKWQGFEWRAPRFLEEGVDTFGPLAEY